MQFTFDVLANIRAMAQKHIENNTLEDLNKIPEGFNNNIIWNIAHMVVTTQVLAYKLSGLPMVVSDEMIVKYKKDSKPEGDVTQAEVDEINGLLISTIKQLEADYKAGVFKNYTEYTVSTTGNTLRSIDDVLPFDLVHEGMHYGYILALSRAVKG
ncbi:DinB family protein [Algibacter lectus]|uniref:DinB family protein n=1 Tax=Algibacter lectus TaxID=221126 RepID=A0A4R8MA60_9FLAO|nr:DinB family protein [Algibacter lectus]MWW24520.1 DinB family protein [Algibacter lectus]TDY62539.1 DinB family protein [Algibacter lectus]